MAAKRRDAGPTFAEVVSQVPETAGVYEEPLPLVNYAALDKFTDADGVRWRRRGGMVEGKALHRLLAKPNMRVLHDYMGETTEVPAADRERFWRTAEERMAKSAYSAFYGWEFKNDQREHLLVVEEHC